jgi:fibronectin type 3 domain-containing protein
LTSQEEASPRLIHLNWFVPTFGQVVQYKIYRSADGGQTFTSIGSVPGTQTTFQDTVACNKVGYRYKVTTVINNDAEQALESVPSNTVPTGSDPLTGCYVVSNFSSPASATKNSNVPITWALNDDFYPTGGDVTNPFANTLYAIGPLPKNCKTTGRIQLLLNGIAQSGLGTFTPSGNQFTFTWNTSGACSGSYTFELNLDSGQIQKTTTPLVLK